ncbi:MAG: hypothetical protein R3E95_04125 [Thiolinea sp.]
MIMQQGLCHFRSSAGTLLEYLVNLIFAGVMNAIRITLDILGNIRHQGEIGIFAFRQLIHLGLHNRQ